MSDKKFIITISAGVDDEAADVSLETWKIDEAAAMGYRVALTEAHGEPMTGIVSAEAINTMDQGPGVVLLTEGDQTSQELPLL